MRIPIRRSRRDLSHRAPILEVLEDRLPPGDALSGVGWGLAGADITRAGLDARPELSPPVLSLWATRSDGDADSPARSRAATSQFRQADAEVHPPSVALSLATQLYRATDSLTSSFAAVAVAKGTAESGTAPALANGLIGAPDVSRTASDPPMPVGNGSTSVVSGARTPATSRKPARSENVAVPLGFERNVGQTDARVDYIAHAGGATIFLTPTAAVFAMQERSAVSDQQSAGLPSRTPEVRSTNAGVALYMDIVGANPSDRAAGVNPLPGKVNYLQGNDPARWHTDIPTYARVEYPNALPGIDVAYYGGPGGLEYDFTVHPGADPHAIRLRFAGADGVEVSAQGDLLVHTAAGDIIHHAPSLYQEADGRRRPVAGGFVLHPGLSPQQSTLVSFDVGPYDKSRPLVIDPLVLGYSTFLGGSAKDFGTAIAVDGKGAAYVTGSTGSSDFPTTPGAYDTHEPSGGFVTKLNTDGSGLVYSTYIPNGGGSGIAVDGAGYAYITGSAGLDFPATIHFGPARHSNAFITKLNPTGSDLVYSAVFGGTSTDYGNAIAIDAAGNAYVAGNTISADFPTTPGAFDPTYNGGPNGDAFAVKLNADGKSLAFSTYLGGSNEDDARGIGVDAAGGVYVAGTTVSKDFPTTRGAFQPVFDKVYDAFVTKFTPTGDALAYSTYLGGAGGDEGWGLAVDPAGHAYVVGGTQGEGFPATAFYGGQFGGTFITKMNPAGSGVVFSMITNALEGLAVAVDDAGNAYATGYTDKNMLTTADAFDNTFNGAVDAFLQKVNADGTAVVYSTFLGGSANEQGNGVAVDTLGDAYLTGTTQSGNFPTTPGAFKPRNRNGVEDAFVTKFAEV
jgi:hypothetical protein